LGLVRRSIKPDLIVLLGWAAWTVAWFAPSLLHGWILYGEDVIFGGGYENRHTLYTLAHGAPFTWWDPRPYLGVPRLAMVEYDYLSPASIIFYLVDTPLAMALYLPLMMFCMGAGLYAFLRGRGLPPLASAFGMASWMTMGIILDHMQHFIVLETLVWLPVALLAWDRFAAGGAGGWAALAGLATGCEILAGHGQYIVYNGILMAAFMAHSLWRAPDRRRLAVGAVGVFATGLLIGLPVSLPAADLLEVSQRPLLPASYFTEGTAPPWAVPLALCREAHLLPAIRTLQTGGPTGYPILPGVSLITILFALRTAGRGRAGWWALIVVFLIGMMGALGGVQHLVPILSRLRYPMRMITPAAFLLAMLAAEGMATWLRTGRPWIALLGIAWVLGTGWFLNHPNAHFGPPPTVPEVIVQAPDRMAVQPFVDPFLIDAPMMVGKECLTCVRGLCPGTYFEAMFASQVGPLDARPDLVDLAGTKAYFPINHADLPLMRAFGLRSVVGRDGIQVFPPFPRCWVATDWRVAPDARTRQAAAAARDWDPAHTAIVAAPLGDFRGPSQVTVQRDDSDAQDVSVEGGGGLLICSGQLMPGWEATVDGQPAAPVLADLALRGVVVGPGHHEVSWRYRPRWLGRAEGGVAIGILLALGLCFVRSRP
jgi:hypothetical protein